MIRTALTLSFIGGLCALALAGTHHLTRERIDTNRQAKARALMQTLAGTAITADIAADQPITGACAQLFLRAEVPGYAGPIHGLGLWRHASRQFSLRVTSHRETPGIGDFIDHERSDWIVRLDAANPDAWREVDRISGATITSEAIARLAQTMIDSAEQHCADD